MYFFFFVPRFAFGCWHLGYSGSSCLCLLVMWFSKDLHLASTMSALLANDVQTDVGTQYMWFMIAVSHSCSLLRFVSPPPSVFIAFFKSLRKPTKTKKVKLTYWWKQPNNCCCFNSWIVGIIYAVCTKNVLHHKVYWVQYDGLRIGRDNKFILLMHYNSINLLFIILF